MAYNNRADVHIEMNNAELAITDLDLAIKLDPGFAVAFANRAFAHALLNDDNKANRDFENAVKLGVDRDLLAEKLEEFKERAK